jgi:hypothetical protein
MNRIERRARRSDHAETRLENAVLDAQEMLDSGELTETEAQHVHDLIAAATAAASETMSSGREQDAIRSNGAFDRLNNYVGRLEESYDLVVGSSSSSSSSGDAAESNALLDLMENPADLADLFEREPAEFMISWRDLTAESRSIVMQRLQSQMQMDNQITQMITNLMKALHDTSMAVARNLKV